jgi:hypothetical protein
MNINFNYLFSQSTSFLKERVLPALTPLQVKVIAVVTLAFASVAAIYAALHHRPKAVYMKKCWPHGAVGEGMFIGDKLNGQGKITFANGTIWEGKFKNDKLHGKGKIIRDKDIEEGEFKDSELCKGKKIKYQGTHIYEGEFLKGELHGQGNITIHTYLGTTYQESGKYQHGHRLHSDGTLDHNHH